MKESALKGCIQISVILALGELDCVSENLVQSLEKSPNVTLTEASFEGELLPVPTPQSLEAIATKEREATVRLELQFRLEEKKLQQELELEMIKARAEARYREAEAQLKEAKAQNLQSGRAVFSTNADYSDPHVPYFNVAAHIKLVPHFQDKDLEAYFATFQHNAQSLGWPDDNGHFYCPHHSKAKLR